MLQARRLKKLSLLIIWPPFITRRTMSALNPDRASRQRDIAIGAAVFEGPAVTLASNAGAPAAAPLASNLLQAAACAPAALCGDRRVRTAKG